ncbi:DegT/DnrJ/EryC1/StrS family aminotransferase [Herbaspirillum lusitanum]|uniref:DegT/DnrJ/EryC1/StrS family aminotransferase n=1 Tax=Herbaspirillum lusitanum TaxID=213312 RepID=A0ABW9A8M5_9BURK
MKNPSVPFVDLHAQYQTIKVEIDQAIADVIENSSFIRGAQVESFEKNFASRVGSPHCVSCANGTDALYIAMIGLKLKAGDEVIVPAMSWISTSETVTQAGGTPVFCDVDQDTYTIDPDCIKQKLTSRTVGIIPVHIYGQPADMASVMKLAEEHNLWVLEDCAQAHLATFNGRTVGTFGVAGSFSFYPGKNLGAMGDAGAVVTAHADLAHYMTMFARHGGVRKGDHQIEGINSRLDGLQAAILDVKLPHLDQWTKARQRVAGVYHEKLKGIPGLTLPMCAPEREHVFHLYVIRHQRRNELAQFLSEKGIQTVINYPVSLPFLPAYKRYGHQHADFPNAFALQETCLSLPIFPELTAEQQQYVVDSVVEFCAGTH